MYYRVLVVPGYTYLFKVVIRTYFSHSHGVLSTYMYVLSTSVINTVVLHVPVQHGSIVCTECCYCYCYSCKKSFKQVDINFSLFFFIWSFVLLFALDSILLLYWSSYNRIGYLRIILVGVNFSKQRRFICSAFSGTL